MLVHDLENASPEGGHETVKTSRGLFLCYSRVYRLRRELSCMMIIIVKPKGSARVVLLHSLGRLNVAEV